MYNKKSILNITLNFAVATVIVFADDKFGIYTTWIIKQRSKNKTLSHQSSSKKEIVFMSERAPAFNWTKRFDTFPFKRV